VTTRREKLLIVKNASANLVRGSASAAVALVLPSFLTRSMSVDAFAAWSLVLQLSAYVGYLDLGIQTAIARLVGLGLLGGIRLRSFSRNPTAHADLAADIPSSPQLLAVRCPSGSLAGGRISMYRSAGIDLRRHFCWASAQ
jgi:hypothetical protein